MRPALLLACFALLACSARTEPSADRDKAPLAIARPETGKAKATIIVTSPAFGPGAAIPPAFSDYGGKASPEIDWTGLPPGTASVALIVEDPDAPGEAPFVHWLAWNIDPGAKGLAANGVPPAQGKNGHGGSGWFGPHPPAGPAHHYHFQVFALDRRLDLAPGADRAALVSAMSNHLLGKGELVGMFAAPR